MTKENCITLIIPVFNGSNTIEYVFDSLELQNNKRLIEKIIFIDDNSSDNSGEKIKEYISRSSYKGVIITHKKSFGLANSYNEGLDIANTDFAILMHQDILLENSDSINLISKTLIENDNIMISCPTFLHTIDIWNNFNFWQKILFSRLINKRIKKFSGKFDCIRIIKNLRFDSETYRTAGEDFDYEIRSREFGNIERTDLEIIHIHNFDKDFGFRALFKKETQLAECYGVNLRRYLQFTPIKDIILILSRPMIFIGLIIPVLHINLISAVIMIFYLFFYTKLVYIRCYNDSRILLLPFINFINLAGYSFYFFRGFLSKKQKI